MNIVIWYNSKDKKMSQTVKKIQHWIQTAPLLQGYLIQLYEFPVAVEQADVGFLFGNNREEITTYASQARAVGMQVIFTENLEPEYVLRCIDITPFVCYMKSDKKTLLLRLQEILTKWEKRYRKG